MVKVCLAKDEDAEIFTGRMDRIKNEEIRRVG